MIAAGVACTHGTSVLAVLAAIEGALKTYGRDRSEITLLATVPRKSDEAGLREAAAVLGLELVVPDDNALKDADTRGETRTTVSLAATGLGSASEAAALAAAGAMSRLLGPRLVLDGVTCALAISGVEA